MIPQEFYCDPAVNNHCGAWSRMPLFEHERCGWCASAPCNTLCGLGILSRCLYKIAKVEKSFLTTRTMFTVQMLVIKQIGKIWGHFLFLNCNPEVALYFIYKYKLAYLASWSLYKCQKELPIFHQVLALAANSSKTQARKLHDSVTSLGSTDLL